MPEIATFAEEEIKTLTLTIGLVAVTGCSLVGSRYLVDDPASAVKGALPDGWVVFKVEEKTHPPYRPEAEGRAIFMGVTGKNYSKIPYEAALYIMPSDYQDGGEDPTGGGAMTSPAHPIATTADAKVYLWQSSRSDELEEDLRKALLK